eukprot:m.137106 g.137106  ORF g.137106 m.137106 type:complete len:1081 (+) comp23979_c5_seq1:1-3243(+)
MEVLVTLKTMTKRASEKQPDSSNTPRRTSSMPETTRGPEDQTKPITKRASEQHPENADTPRRARSLPETVHGPENQPSQNGLEQHPTPATRPPARASAAAVMSQLLIRTSDSSSSLHTQRVQLEVNQRRKLRNKIIYISLRVLLYLSSSIISAITIHYDDSDQLWHIGKGNVLYSLQVMVCGFALIDTVSRWTSTQEKKTRERFFNFYDLLNTACVLLVVISFDLEHRTILVPLFLHIWTARKAFGELRVYYGEQLQVTHCAMDTEDFENSSALAELVITCVCILWTAVMGFTHFEKAHRDGTPNLFDSLWFTVVTFSTVGYGNITPEAWEGRLFVIGMILAAIILLPEQLERISHLRHQQALRGTAYLGANHIVLCGGLIHDETLSDFLTQIYDNRMDDEVDRDVVILSSCAMSDEVERLILRPKYKRRVHYLVGSALVVKDLMRVRADDAYAVFIVNESQDLAAEKADENVILRSWAFNDFAPHARLFVEIALLDNIEQVKFAWRVVCLDNLRYALLSQSCTIPGISTFLSNLLNRVPGNIDPASDQEKLYHRSASNLILTTLCGYSVVFAHFVDRLFADAVLRGLDLGICLFAVLNCRDNEIVLNPKDYVLEAADVLFYIAPISETQYPEEGRLHAPSSMEPLNVDEDELTTIPRDLEAPTESLFVFDEFSRAPTTRSETPTPSEEGVFTPYVALGKLPRHAMYPGSVQYECHMIRHKHLEDGEAKVLLNHPRTDLQLTKENLGNKEGLIVLSILSGAPSSGVFEFIRGLRAQHLDPRTLIPCVLLVHTAPSEKCRKFMSLFPDVFFVIGDIISPSSLVRACLGQAATVMIVRGTETTPSAKQEERLFDAPSVMATQSVLNNFPHLRVVTELAFRDNMRFLKFEAVPCDPDAEPDHQNRHPKTSLSRNWAFRSSYIQGMAFSTSLTNSLLYQSFHNDREALPELIRQLLGCKDVAPEGGYLRTLSLTERLLKRTGCRSYLQLSKMLIVYRNMVCLGLYRKADIGGFHRTMVLAHPPGETEVFEGDLVYVLDNHSSAVWTRSSPIQHAVDKWKKETVKANSEAQSMDSLVWDHSTESP